MTKEKLDHICKEYLIPNSDPHLFNTKDICKECGGRCCKQMGCHFSPSQFKNLDAESLISFIKKTDAVSIDWFEPDKKYPERMYYLRTKNNNAMIIDPSFGGRCSLLGPSGCRLKDEYRPYGGSFLIALKHSSCEPRYTKEECANEWHNNPKAREAIEKAYEYFSQNSISGDGIFSYIMSFLQHTEYFMEEGILK